MSESTMLSSFSAAFTNASVSIARVRPFVFSSFLISVWCSNCFTAIGAYASTAFRPTSADIADAATNESSRPLPLPGVAVRFDCGAVAVAAFLGAGLLISGLTAFFSGLLAIVLYRSSVAFVAELPHSTMLCDSHSLEMQTQLCACKFEWYSSTAQLSSLL